MAVGCDGPPKVLLSSAFRRPFAHRGLHDGSRPDDPDKAFENTLAAFEAAIAVGFGIECDVRDAEGGLPVVFHDREIPAGLPFAGRPVASLGNEEILRFSYSDGGPLLTFADFLAAVGGRVPILAELKFDGEAGDPRFLASVAGLASGYGGALALMSFEPQPLAELGRLAGAVPRGLVAKRFDEDPADVARLGASEARRRSTASDLPAIGGSFVAYDLPGLASLPPGALGLAEGDMLFAWTVRSSSDLELSQRLVDAPICESEAARLLISPR